MVARKSEALEAAKVPPEHSLRAGQGSAIKSIVVNSGLGAAKLAAGILGNSYALIADASESFGDVLGSCVTFYGLRIAAEPADSDHPAGHGRAETIASVVSALALITVGALIFTHAAQSIYEPRSAPSPLTLLVLVPVIVIKEFMFHYIRKRGKAIGSLALVADAWHQRSDVLTSVAALIGIGVAWIGGKGWEHSDSWAAMVASIWLAGTGLWLVGPALHELMEGKVDPALLRFMARSAGEVDGIKGIDKVWARKLGMRLIVDLHIEVDPAVSVEEGHRLAHEVKDKLQHELPQVRDVMVHVEPFHPGRERRPHRAKVEATR